MKEGYCWDRDGSRFSHTDDQLVGSRDSSDLLIYIYGTDIRV